VEVEVEGVVEEVVAEGVESYYPERRPPTDSGEVETVPRTMCSAK
jgi:hypothetical protein